VPGLIERAAMGLRRDGREPADLRPITFIRDFTEFAPGSVLVEFGRTRVLCTASVETRVPQWLRGSGRGWVTAEYSMLPGSTPERVEREAHKGRPSGRTQEIQRLIGRSLRAVTALDTMGEVQITVDCDVLQADGGTRTASICGGYVALHDACSRLVHAQILASHPVTDQCGAISVGVVEALPYLDLDYSEDVRAEVDMNVVMTGAGRFVEVQGTAEGLPFSRAELDALLDLAESGIREIFGLQRELLADPPAPRPIGRA
jgi:ribonuclease PH